MKKYLVVIKNSLQEGFAYRGDVLFYVLAEAFSLGVYVYLWYSIYRQGGQLGAYTYSGLVFYFILTKFISMTIFWSPVAHYVGDDIWEGRLSFYLIKPLNYLRFRFAYSIGTVLNRLVIFIFLFAASIYKFELLVFNPTLIVYFAASLIIGFIIYFLIFYLVGIATFFLGLIWGFNFIVFNITQILSGGLIPLDLFPEYIFRIAGILPFKFITYFPIMVISGKIDPGHIRKEFLLGIAWIIILYIINRLTFKRGVKTYEAFGN